MRPGSTLALAQRLEAGTLSLGEAFTFMSGLYFRGKIAYAMAFGRRADGRQATYVITPTRGLQSPDLPITRALVEEFAAVDVADDEPRYFTPLVADARALADALPDCARVVLLGSVATSKYVEVLGEALGAAPPLSVRLHRARRHEPRRADVAERRQWCRARIHSGGRGHQARPTASAIGPFEALTSGAVHAARI